MAYNLAPFTHRRKRVAYQALRNHNLIYQCIYFVLECEVLSFSQDDDNTNRCSYWLWWFSGSPLIVMFVFFCKPHGMGPL